MGAQSVMSAQPTATPRRSGHRIARTTLAFWAFVGPMMLGLLVFTYIPIVWGLYLSFFEARSTVTPQQFVGLANYVYMITNPAFIESLITFSIFALFIVPTTFALSLGLALLVNSARHGQGFFRSVFFIPTACSYVVASLVWRMNLFNSLPYGFANIVLYWFGLDPIVWIGTTDPPWYWLVLVTLRLWLQVGFYMILFLAGLQEIPRPLYEAASVDGASSGWTTFRYITFPLLRNTSVSVLLLNLIAAFQAFDEFYNVLTGTAASSNINLARPPLVYLYQVAISNQDYGRGSAGAFILAGIIVIITLFQGRFLGFGKAVQ
ncbi:MAG: sugar ABC transporter permease [Caldilineaceae bacterium]|nr:sugar ABC transporter permease [Caldilineaceae bacterium]